MERYLQNNIYKDLKKKMVILTGPRQVGKTFLSQLISKSFQSPIYLNFDDVVDMKVLRDRTWPRASDLVIMDEVHKMKGWKSFLKGTVDTAEIHQRYLITGSARLDTFRQTGDSLAGRYYRYRLNPLSVKELEGQMKPHEALTALMRFGGFPEPFLSGSEREANRWRKQYYTDIVREDVQDFSRVHEIKTIRLLVELLRKRVGSPLSYASLSRDLQVAPNTVKKYVSILESLYVIFLIRPFHKNIARSILKEPKAYFYDSGYVDGDEGVKFENAVAVSLLKHLQYLEDVEGESMELGYLRTKEGNELDFVRSCGDRILEGIEVKLSDSEVSSAFKYFSNKVKGQEPIKFTQLVLNLKKGKDISGISVVPAAEWLATLKA